MAEKKYKNYDERFLKEDSSSSEPIVIEGYFADDSKDYVVISEWADGTPIKTADDLESVFNARAAVSYSTTTSASGGTSVVHYKGFPILMQRHTGQGQEVALLVNALGIAITTEEIYNNFIKQS